MSARETLDLGTLAFRRRGSDLPGTAVFAAPSPWTRAVWLAGALGCLVFVWSVALPLGWLERVGPGPLGLRFGRLPTLFESVFWLLPLLLAALAVALSLGGVRLVIDRERVRVGGRALELERLLKVRLWEERSRSRELLYGVAFVFAATEVVWRTADRAAWGALRDRFEGTGL